MAQVNGTNYITSFSQSGLHRNSNEISKSRQVGSGIVGFNLQRISGNYSVGITAVHHWLSEKMKTKEDVEYYYNRNESSISNLGIYVSKSFHNSSAFGEFSKSVKHGNAYLFGINSMPTNKLALAFLYRNYSVNYHPIYSASFGENSINKNERGFYSAFKIYLTKKTTYSFYMDHFSFPWLKHNVSIPSNGVEYLSEIKYRQRKKMEGSVRYKYKQKMVNASSDQHLLKVNEAVRQSLRFQLNYMLSKNLRFRSRIEFSLFKLKEEFSGFLTF